MRKDRLEARLRNRMMQKSTAKEYMRMGRSKDNPPILYKKSTKKSKHYDGTDLAYSKIKR